MGERPDRQNAVLFEPQILRLWLMNRFYFVFRSLCFSFQFSRLAVPNEVGWCRFLFDEGKTHVNWNLSRKIIIRSNVNRFRRDDVLSYFPSEGDQAIWVTAEWRYFQQMTIPSKDTLVELFIEKRSHNHDSQRPIRLLQPVSMRKFNTTLQAVLHTNDNHFSLKPLLIFQKAIKNPKK